MINTKLVYSPIDRRNDGLRILVARFHLDRAFKAEL